MSVHPDGVDHLPTPEQYRDAWRRLRFAPDLPRPIANRLRKRLEIGGFAVLSEAARLDAIAANNDTPKKQAARLAQLEATIYQEDRS